MNNGTIDSLFAAAWGAFVLVLGLAIIRWSHEVQQLAVRLSRNAFLRNWPFGFGSRVNRRAYLWEVRAVGILFLGMGLVALTIGILGWLQDSALN